MYKDRIIWIDAVRVIALWMIIIIHSPLPPGESNIVLAIYNYLSAPAIGLFFMISGALLLPVKDMTAETFYKKRLSKIGIPLIVWSLFYILIHTGNNELSIEYFFSEILLIPFKPVEGVLWFVYTLIGLYLIAPVLSAWLNKASQKTIKLILLFWSITLFFPYINIIIPGIYVEKPTNAAGIVMANPLFYFSGYIGYFLLGYYLNKYPLKLKGKKFLLYIIIFLLFSVVLPGVVYLNPDINIENSLLYRYLTINMALLSIVYFSLIQKLSFKIILFNNFLVDLSKMSFGIYLIHIFILRDIIWHWFDMVYIVNPVIQVPLMAFLTLIFSYFIIKMISYLPKSKYMVGI